MFRRESHIMVLLKQIRIDFFKVITKLHVTASTSTQTSDHRIFQQTNGWHEVEAK